MHPLHDHDDTRRCLVVAALKQGGTVPFDDSRPHGLRHGVAKLERIVDDDQVSHHPKPRKSRGEPFNGRLWRGQPMTTPMRTMRRKSSRLRALKSARTSSVK